MDPIATLRAAYIALSHKRVKDAHNLLDEYDAWRRIGGFQPHIAGLDVDGDKFAGWLRDHCVIR